MKGPEVRAFLQQPVRISRTVDGGQVHCPVRMEMVSHARCESCDFLDGVSNDASGNISQLACAPTVRALTSNDD